MALKSILRVGHERLSFYRMILYSDEEMQRITGWTMEKILAVENCEGTQEEVLLYADALGLRSIFIPINDLEDEDFIPLGGHKALYETIAKQRERRERVRAEKYPYLEYEGMRCRKCKRGIGKMKGCVCWGGEPTV